VQITVERKKRAASFVRNPIVASILIVATQYSHAAENGAGVYPLGLRGPFAGIVPAPGVYFQNDFFFYQGDASASRPLPLNGNLVADVHASMPVDIPTILW
jgi:hypothetical protein